ncbi:MAG: hypothetical protein V2I51_06770 [Anderseniella sp.]|jgi:hypothetical protein|nr:hypothetical protein [Anderseniella sp.]
MEAVKVAEHARALLAAHGDKAEAEAAQKARAARDANNTAEADQWSKVRKAIAELRGSNVS